ncbi:MAG: transposase [Candidatus Poribacteria bacterium]|nr:transposase [Candidatus Poribacteria bacterium]
MAKRRNFTAKFKAEVVLEALSGESSQAEVCRRHNLSSVKRVCQTTNSIDGVRPWSNRLENLDIS